MKKDSPVPKVSYEQRTAELRRQLDALLDSPGVTNNMLRTMILIAKSKDSR